MDQSLLFEVPHHFKRLADGIDVTPLMKRLVTQPGLWSELTFRQNAPGTPHSDTESIYLRWARGMTKEDIFYTDDAVDWPAIGKLQPELEPFYARMVDAAQATELGRAMLVRLKPGGEIKPHADEGTYAEHYDRLHLVLQADEGNEMRVGGHVFSPQPGEIWWFNHKLEHSFRNNSSRDRIHLIADFKSPLRAQRGVTFQRERLFETWSEVMPLTQAHYEEIAHYKDIPLAPDFDKFAHRERSGGLRFHTVRDGGVLVGYAAFFVSPSLHYSGSLQAAADVIFVLPSHRKNGTGKAFIVYCDERLKAEGVQVVAHHVKAKRELNFGPLLERMGYELMDQIYVRRLD